MSSATAVLPLFGLTLLGAVFVTAALQSRGRLPFAVPEGAYVAVSVGAVSVVAQSLVGSDRETVAILAVGALAWATGYETARGDDER
ncbi:hypothetical protein PM022_07005 [Halorubrum ezzemoulense]|uniref:hypothetical protein n=1 Tax=Halorubrum ezzemoulense TaxID=337243 RepID=UPI002330F87B|nr:hypothetical protein [Halorubrum ezzemoulense]MDB2274298.1 hypothetical protein [Halorubrum ezzemoulense]MDB9301885.1 hypothetical protein [Halorubrum ezzemoulense]